MSDLSNTADMPAWFNGEIHRVADGGIFETATGVLLGEDGEPKSAAVRMLRADAAAEAEAAEAVAEPAKKSRDTRQIIEAAAIAAGNETPKE